MAGLLEILRFTGLSDEYIFVLLVWCAHNITYYAWALPCQWLYRNNYFLQWKIEPTKHPRYTAYTVAIIKSIIILFDLSKSYN